MKAEDDEWHGKDWTRNNCNDWSGWDGTSLSSGLEQRTENVVDGEEAGKASGSDLAEQKVHDKEAEKSKDGKESETKQVDDKA